MRAEGNSEMVLSRCICCISARRPPEAECVEVVLKISVREELIPCRWLCKEVGGVGGVERPDSLFGHVTRRGEGGGVRIEAVRWQKVNQTANSAMITQSRRTCHAFVTSQWEFTPLRGKAMLSI